MIELFFTICGVLLLAYLAVMLFMGIAKVGFIGFFVGLFGLLQSFFYLKKWWAILIQTPFFALYVLLFYFESWTAIPYILFFQITIGFLFHSIIEMINNKNKKYPSLK